MAARVSVRFDPSQKGKISRKVGGTPHSHTPGGGDGSFRFPIVEKKPPRAALRKKRTFCFWNWGRTEHSLKLLARKKFRAVRNMLALCIVGKRKLLART